MERVYYNDIINFQELVVDNDKSLFDSILASRKGYIDEKRFFLDYISPEELELYDFNDLESLRAFRRKCLTMDDPLIKMGGCNMHPDYLEKGFRYSGIKMSDPSEEIKGIFDRHDGVLTYSPIFPRFYEERDLIKFARERYFTTLTFEEVLRREVEDAEEFRVHVDNYKTSKDIAKYGPYVMENVSKDEFIEFINNPDLGEKIKSKALRYWEV